MGDMFDTTIADTVDRLQAARERAPQMETDQALARLESALFGAPTRRQVMDRYPLIRTLGQGGSGVVYLAYDPRLDRKVAIKLLTQSRAAGRGATVADTRLLREAQAMARSPHPHVIAVYDVGTYTSETTGEESVFIVMEYVEGPTLATWLEAKHDWREVVRIFLEAGHGLAAAHEVGVIHRDFKPENVIVGDDGRVRVLDFGLARGSERAEPVTEATEVTDSAPIELDANMTEDGTVLGTPAYMAPEQHEGLAADAATDQFGFCVALWEGVFGRRPFHGRSFESLLVAKLSGPPSPPEGHDVPGWLVDALRRGLRPERGERWPDMGGLLHALERGLGRARRLRRGVLAGLGAAALATTTWAALPDASAPTPCSGGAERLESVWGPTRRDAMVAAFRATERPFAIRTAERLASSFDDFSAAWVGQHREACEATVVRSEQSQELMDLRMACLDRQARAVDATLDVLEEVDAQTVVQAHEVVAAIPVPADCGDTDVLLAAVPPPSDPVVARAVEQQRDRLARMTALHVGGRLAEALALAESVVSEAEPLGYEPLLAEALTERGSLESHNGHHERAEQTLERAHALALSIGHDAPAARASQRLTYVTGDRLGRLEDGLRWASIAEAEYRRAGQSRRQAPLLMARGSAYETAGRSDEARTQTEAALALLESAPDGPQAYLIPVAHSNLGNTLRSQGDLLGAREHLEHALELWRRDLGPDHPDVAIALNNLGLVDLAEGDRAAAIDRFRRANEIRRESLGPSHPVLASSLSNLGITLRHDGDHAGARAAFEEAEAVLRRAHGPDAPDLVGIYSNMAVLDRAEGDVEAAERHLLRAIERQPDPEHPTFARILHNHALNLLSLDRLEDAVAEFGRSEAINEQAFGADHAVLVERRLDFAQALREAGEEARAVALVERARTRLPADAAPELSERIEAWLAARPEGYPRDGD